MPYLFTQLSRADAEERMADLIAANVPAKLRYIPDGNAATDREYAIEVAPGDVAEAQAALGLREDTPEEAAEMENFVEPDSSLYQCPRCGLRKIGYPDEPVGRIMLLSIPLLMLPALGFLIWRASHGTKKECRSCRHVWRSKP